MAAKTAPRACAFLLLAIAATVLLENAPATAQTPPSVNWVQCANDSATCVFGVEVQPSDVVTVRYGVISSNVFHYVLVSGSVASVPCTSAIFGNPLSGNSEACAYTTSSAVSPSFGNPPSNDAAWTKIVNDSAPPFTLPIPANVAYWVRYVALPTTSPAAPSKSIYTLVAPQILTSPVPPITFSGGCNQNRLGSNFDLNSSAQKECQFTPVNAVTSFNWAACAQEGMICTLANSGIHLVSYQSRENNTNGLASYVFSQNPSFNCNTDTFGGRDPVGQIKQCFTFKLAQ